MLLKIIVLYLTLLQNVILSMTNTFSGVHKVQKEKMHLLFQKIQKLFSILDKLK